MNFVDRACPYAKFKVFAPQDVFYSRKMHYVSHPPSILDSMLVYSINEVEEGFTNTTDGSNMEFVAASDGRLPREISLHRSESYMFELYLYKGFTAHKQ